MSRALLPIRHREAFLDDRMGFEDGQMVTDGKDEGVFAADAWAKA